MTALPVYDADEDKYRFELTDPLFSLIFCRAFVDCYDIVAYLLKVREIATRDQNIKVSDTDERQVTLSHEIAELDIPVGEAMSMFYYQYIMFAYTFSQIIRRTTFYSCCQRIHCSEKCCM